jgi:hypothetical protein
MEVFSFPGPLTSSEYRHNKEYQLGDEFQGGLILTFKRVEGSYVIPCAFKLTNRRCRHGYRNRFKFAIALLGSSLNVVSSVPLRWCDCPPMGGSVDLSAEYDRSYYFTIRGIQLHILPGDTQYPGTKTELALISRTLQTVTLNDSAFILYNRIPRDADDSAALKIVYADRQLLSELSTHFKLCQCAFESGTIIHSP